MSTGRRPPRPPPEDDPMRPLAHPSADTITIEGILHALSDPVRARLYAEIAQAECPRTCTALVQSCNQAVPKSTLSQHFKVLREAGLIHSERRGVELHNRARSDELQERFGALIRAILDAHRAQNERAARRSKRSKRG
jgi:DNA-binding transcriptional ArsR family regulator